MNSIDGRALAKEIQAEISAAVLQLPASPRLAILSCNPNFETLKYLELKKQTADGLGIELIVTLLPPSVTTADCLAEIAAMTKDFDGIVVQLPLPPHIDTAAVLAALPPSHDVDVFRYQGESGEVLPPVIGAIAEIAKRYEVSFTGKRVVIFGSGRLVGAPAALYARHQGAEVTVITPDTAAADVLTATQAADSIILGVGKPGLLTAAMVKPGVVVFDAGASEDGGLLVGDAAPEVATKAALLTPVPGGIGPLTVALLFRNLLELQKRQ